MPTVTHTADLPGSPDQIWSVISDLSRYGDWNVTHSGFPDGAPQLTDGTSFRERITIMGMPGEATWTVKDVAAPNRLVLEGAGPMGVQLGQSIELSGNGAATTISFSASFDGGPLAGPMGAAVAKSAEKAAEESLGKLRTLLG